MVWWGEAGGFVPVENRSQLPNVMFVGASLVSGPLPHLTGRLHIEIFNKSCIMATSWAPWPLAERWLTAEANIAQIYGQFERL